MESYAAEGRIKVKLGSQVLQFEPDSVTLALGDGSQKRYPNDAGFVLIGADPPIQWLEKMGIRFVERPHQHQMGKTDDILRRFVPRAAECPEDAARAAAQILGGSVGIAPEPQVAAAAAAMGMPMGEPVSGPRKWLRSATSIFSSGSSGASRGGTNPGIQAAPPRAEAKAAKAASGGGGKKFDAPVPLSEFAKRGKTQGIAAAAPGQSSVMHHMHTGHGRRDQLSAGERTRILRMLRDEGGRIADEDSGVYIGGMPSRQYDVDFDDSPAPALGGPPPQAPMQLPPQAPMQLPPQAPMQLPPQMQSTGRTPGPMGLRPDVPAKPALVVGLEQAKLNKKPSAVQGVPAQRRDVASKPVAAAPVPPPQQTRGPAPGPSRGGGQARRPVPPPFNDEPTRQVDDHLLTALRAQQGQGAPQGRPSPAPLPPPLPPPTGAHGPSFNDEPTRMQTIDPRAYDQTGPGEGPYSSSFGDRSTAPRGYPAGQQPVDPGGFGLENNYDEATHIASLDGIAAMERARHQAPTGNDERTRAVNIRSDPSISDIDWDLD
jgi:hypothetical protein